MYTVPLYLTCQQGLHIKLIEEAHSYRIGLLLVQKVKVDGWWRRIGFWIPNRKDEWLDDFLQDEVDDKK